MIAERRRRRCGLRAAATSILGVLLIAGGLIGLLFIRPEADRKRLAAHAVALPPLAAARPRLIKRA